MRTIVRVAWRNRLECLDEVWSIQASGQGESAIASTRSVRHGQVKVGIVERNAREYAAFGAS